MNKGGGDDDTGTELPEDGEDGILWRDIRGDEDGRKDADRAGRQHDEQQANAEADVVVPVDAGTALGGATAPASAVSVQVSIVNMLMEDVRHTLRPRGSGSFAHQTRSRCDHPRDPPRGPPLLLGEFRPPPRWGRCKGWRELEPASDGV